MPPFGLDRLRSLGLLSAGGAPIAIDFGARWLKALQLSAVEPPTLAAAACLEVPESLAGDAAKRVSWQFEQLPKLIKSGGFRGKRAVCTIPSSHTFSKHLQLAVSEDVPLATVASAAVAGQLNCMPDSLLCRPMAVPGAATAGGNKAEVITMTAARAFVGRLMEAVRACRLEPVGMFPECLALLRVFDHMTKRAEDQQLVSLYLDIGHGATTVVIAHGRDMVFTKTITLGGRFFDQTISKQAHCGMVEAREMRLKMTSLARAATAPVRSSAPTGMEVLEAAIRKAQAAGAARSMSPEGAQAQAEADTAATATEERRVGKGPPSGCTTVAATGPGGEVDPRVDLTEPLETLTDEINMCLRYHDAMFPGRRVNRTIFVGGEAGHAGLCQHIARALRLPAHVADPMARLARAGGEPVSGVDLTKPQPGWAVALGLCLSPTDL